MLGPTVKSPEIGGGDVAGLSLVHDAPFQVHVSFQCGFVIDPSNRSPFSTTRLAVLGSNAMLDRSPLGLIPLEVASGLQVLPSNAHVIAASRITLLVGG